MVSRRSDPVASSLLLLHSPSTTNSRLWPLAEPEICDEDNFGLWYGRRPQPERWLRSGCPRSATGEGQGAGAGRDTCPSLRDVLEAPRCPGGPAQELSAQGT